MKIGLMRKSWMRTEYVGLLLLSYPDILRTHPWFSHKSKFHFLDIHSASAKYVRVLSGTLFHLFKWVSLNSFFLLPSRSLYTVAGSFLLVYSFPLFYSFFYPIVKSVCCSDKSIIYWRISLFSIYYYRKSRVGVPMKSALSAFRWYSSCRTDCLKASKDTTSCYSKINYSR